MVTVPMGPARVDLTGIRAGDRNQFGATITQGGAPFNLTGRTVTAQARLKKTDPDPPALTAVVAITNAAGGAITVRWPGPAVATLLGGAETWTGVWDLQVTGAVVGEDPLTVAEGTFGAVLDVTRP